MTIAEAAAQVLRTEKNPLSVEEILRLISLRGLYRFNSPDALAILREQMRRHCELPNKTLQYKPTLFAITADGLFSLNPGTMNKKTPSIRRVRRASDKEDVIERLSKKSDTVFVDIWKLLVFAASIGLNSGRREEILQFDSGKSIDITYFSGCAAWPGLLHLIGLVETKDPKILNPDQTQWDRRILLFEEYANAGLTILRDVCEPRDYSIDSLLHLFGSLGQNDASDPVEVQI